MFLLSSTVRESQQVCLRTEPGAIAPAKAPETTPERSTMIASTGNVESKRFKN